MSKQPAFDPKQFSDTMKESAQQIWLAGLGAFSKVQHEGGKVFETLVKDGLSIQHKTQKAAEEKLVEASQQVSQMSHQIAEKATGQWDKLETIFEDRVARALSRLGHPAIEEFQTLQKRIEQLESQLGVVKPKRKAPAKKTSPAKTIKR